MAKQDLAFEHKVVQPLKPFGGKNWLLAVSGGVDSMVLAEVLFRWSRLLKIKLFVAHVHHGLMGSPVQKKYRARAQKTVAAWCRERGIPYFTNEAETVELKSEADLRDYRQKFLNEWRKDCGAEFTVYAHHLDDQFETRVLRLIRGTGAFGLKGMRLKAAAKLRPMLECPRAEIENYARLRSLKFVQDPSNRKTESLRNWLRHSWLPALEKKRPGARASMARSLEILSGGSETAVVESPSDGALRRDEIIPFSLPEREKIVARYLRGLGLKNYSRAHVREILKRMESPGKNRTFRMLGVVFEVTPDLFWASGV